MLSNRLLRNPQPFTQALTRSLSAKLARQDYIDLDHNTTMNHYAPFNVVIDRGEGIYVWDVDGRRYIDALCGIGACNQGHVHPRIYKTFVDQASQITLTSRAFHNTQLGEFGKYITDLLGFDRFIPMNTGVEGDETAIKIMRRWAYRSKGVPDNEAIVLFPKNNFWGRTIASRSTSDNPFMTTQFGPFTKGFDQFTYNDPAALEEKLKNPNVAGVLIEPVQGEGGLNFPNDGYMQEVRALCTKYNAIMCVDEIQTGFGRTGYLMGYNYDQVRPDMVVMGKALSGGMMPVSGCVADQHIMEHIKPGDHGCTYGGNPLAMATAHEAVKVLMEEGMVENSKKMGKLLLDELQKIKSPLLKEVRGRGLYVALEVKQAEGIKVAAHELVLSFIKSGVITIKSKAQSARLMPPLTMTESQVYDLVEATHNAVKDLEKVNESLQ